MFARIDALPGHRKSSKGLWSTLTCWAELRRQRRHLSDLTDAQLRDIGLDRLTAKQEAERRMWDVPDFWLK